MSCTRYAQPLLKARLMAGRNTRLAGAPRQARHVRRDYIVQAVLSAPDWVDRKALQALRDEASAKTAQTGVEHVLDHIVPLKHPMVCGLTVPWNLAVVPRAVNAAKSNYWCEWQGDLFQEAA